MTTRPSRLIVIMAVAMLLAACGGGAGGGGGGNPTPSPTLGGGVASASASASAAVSGPPASAPASAGGSGASVTHAVPDDACSVLSESDIKGIFAGTVEPVENDDDDDNSCSFAVMGGNGLLKDEDATTPQIIGITFDEGWIGYAEEKAAMGAAVDKVDGLGAEAWLGAGAIHIDLGEDNELIVTTTFGAIYDPTIIEGERYSVAKLVLSRL